MKKKALVTLLTLGILISAGYFGSNLVLAEENQSQHDNLVSKIAEKFNLNKSDVQAVFDAVRDERRDEMKKDREQRLADAVKDGVITESQKEALISRMEQAFEERKQNRDEVKAWLTSQGIDMGKLREYLPFGEGHKGPRL